ncbi:non-homologous end-joining DNA ligase [Pyxidicoccus sp. MSG2]|uniref:non-homologous end-joining DNA ligase n=1 Tax=Pyxidicoccus sp. MSG2 TaxID=2996790 RepID=UPI002270AD8E|nr:non-homologous end-joining DNA ligase [Pyxidicoccus sp. MSG2]MCY1016852.1 non-homologous end-joining DNA ligase [Pyxidicoccus sp. MSG2]
MSRPNARLKTYRSKRDFALTPEPAPDLEARPHTQTAVRTPEALLERVWPPMLARLSVPEAVSDTTHVYEVKYDGFRAVASLVGGKLAFHSRRGNDLSARFPALAEALRGLDVRDAVMDGEIVALDAKGRSRFQLLQNQAGVEQRYVIFDLLWLDGEDLRGLPLEERRARLEQLLKGVKPPLQLSERVEVSLTRALATAQRRGWEGLIAKRKGSAYVGTRSDDWLKLKVLAGQEVVILGYLPIQNERAKTEIGALLLGVHDEAGFHDVGKVGTGFSTKDRRSLRKLLDKDRVSQPMAADAEPRKGAVWVRPKHVAQVQFTEWTEDGRLRHPVYQGLRTDKQPVEVVRELPAPVARKARRAEAGALPEAARNNVRPVREGTAGREGTSVASLKAARAGARTTRAGTAGRQERATTGTRRAPTALAARTAAVHAKDVETETSVGRAKLTHGDRVIFPDSGLMKADVFAYYREVAPLLVPVLETAPSPCSSGRRESKRRASSGTRCPACPRGCPRCACATRRRRSATST